MLQAKKYTTEHLQHLKNKVSTLYRKKIYSTTNWY